MEFTWEADVAEGVLRNSALSAELRFAAIAKTVIQPFVKTEPGYGRNKGESLTLPRIGNLAIPANARLGETNRMSIDTFAQSSFSIEVAEWGRGVEYTHKSQLLTTFNREDAIQKVLRKQMQLILDVAAATAYKAGKIKFIPTTLANGTFDTDGTPSTAALVNGTVAHIKVIRDYMMDTIHVPGYDDSDQLICLASTKFLRGLKNDPEFIEWNKAQNREEAFARGFVGNIENVRFIEVNNTNALSNAKGTGSVLGEAVIFGDDAVSMIVAQDPEVLAAIPGDFGRAKAVAWYGLMEWGQPWGDSASDGEARVVHITSS